MGLGLGLGVGLGLGLVVTGQELGLGLVVTGESADSEKTSQKKTKKEKKKNKKPKNNNPAVDPNVPGLGKMDIRVGLIVKAWEHENSDKVSGEPLTLTLTQTLDP